MRITRGPRAHAFNGDFTADTRASITLGWIVRGVIKLNQDKQNFHLSFATLAFCFEFEHTKHNRTAQKTVKNVCLQDEFYTSVNALVIGFPEGGDPGLM